MNGWAIRLLAAGALLLTCAVSARTAWVWQANAYSAQLANQADDYGKQLAEKDRIYGLERERAAAVALDHLAVQQQARSALEARLRSQAQNHWQEMQDAQQTQARLRDRLATTDLRLSVLVDSGAVARSGCDGGVRETAGTYVENLSWLACAERHDRAHTFFYMDPPYWQTAGYALTFPSRSTSAWPTSFADARAG